jgi:hypothetical protein
VSVQKPKLANPEWVRGITDDGLGNYGTVLDIVRAGLIYAPRTKGLVKDFTEGFLHQVKKQNPATSSNGESGDG